MEAGPALEALDFAQLRNVTLNDRALMRELIGSLLTDASRHIEELRSAIDRADTVACGRLAHGLMGACGNVGAVSMAALFESLERQAERGDLSQSSWQIESLLRELPRLRRAAEAI